MEYHIDRMNPEKIAEWAKMHGPSTIRLSSKRWRIGHQTHKRNNKERTNKTIVLK